MEQLGIKGHATRGKEVIEILEMLGGKSYTRLAYKGEDPDRYYCINKYSNFIDSPLVLQDVQIFSLEEFIEKFPYKVGDKVIVSETQKVVTIEHMSWRDNKVVYETCYNDDCVAYYTTNDLQPYKEENMEEIKIDIPRGYEFAGVDDDKQQVVFTKIQPEYPKTYKECIGQLPINWDGEVKGYKCELLLAFQKLLIARDVYWKIYGEQMGLGKSWEPDWENTETDKYVIEIVKNTITIHDYPWNETNHLLAFPTKEMRDAFYENFKDLIIECKKLL